jgi:hypothetical protein
MVLSGIRGPGSTVGAPGGFAASASQRHACHDEPIVITGLVPVIPIREGPALF